MAESYALAEPCLSGDSPEQAKTWVEFPATAFFIQMTLDKNVKHILLASDTPFSISRFSVDHPIIRQKTDWSFLPD